MGLHQATTPSQGHWHPQTGSWTGVNSGTPAQQPHKEQISLEKDSVIYSTSSAACPLETSRAKLLQRAFGRSLLSPICRHCGPQHGMQCLGSQRLSANRVLVLSITNPTPLEWGGRWGQPASSSPVLGLQCGPHIPGAATTLTRLAWECAQGLAWGQVG